jgi:hypothetical protein
MHATRAIGLILASTLAGTALAHPDSDALSKWYRSLTARSGASCCSEHDCLPVDARLVGEEWQIHGENGWEAVPAEAVLRRENLDGRPILCRYFGMIRCFVPPAGS